MKYTEMSTEQLENELKKVRAQYERIKGLGLNLDMSRGKPSPQQLSLSEDLLKMKLTSDDYFNEQGMDCRNYGGLDGVIEIERAEDGQTDVPGCKLGSAQIEPVGDVGKLREGGILEREEFWDLDAPTPDAFFERVLHWRK